MRPKVVIAPTRRVALVWVLCVVVMSAVARARPDWLASVAASPDRIDEGKLWYLVTSGMLVDRPIVVSIACFVALAALALLVCGTRTFWWSAFLGQIVATLLVYGFVAAVRAVVPAAFESVMASPDYGVSTVSAAWLGAIATVGWRRRGRTGVGRFWIAASCVAVGLFAYTVRPDLSVLSSEHLVAFGLSVASTLAGPALTGRPAWRRSLELKRPRMRTAVAALAALAAAIVAVPAGVAALRHAIVPHLRPTVTRCVTDWNTLPAAPRALAVDVPPTLVSLTTQQLTTPRDFGAEARPPHPISYCRYVLVARRGATVVLGRWLHGRIDEWTTTSLAPAQAPRHGNAAADRRGRLRLVHQRGHRLVLTS